MDSTFSDKATQEVASSNSNNSSINSNNGTDLRRDQNIMKAFENLSSSIVQGNPEQRVTQLKQGFQNLLSQKAPQVQQGFQNLGSKLQKINLSKLIDQMETDQGLADQLEMFNERMQEEMMRRDIRREAEALSLQVMQEHLDEFLKEHPQGTYDEWIAALHPENANQGKLLADVQEIDLRFYVEESDHRKLWNSRVGADGDDSYRLVPARTSMFADNHNTNSKILANANSGRQQQQQQQQHAPPLLDLLSMDTTPTNQSNEQQQQPTVDQSLTTANKDNVTTSTTTATDASNTNNDVDLISF